MDNAMTCLRKCKEQFCFIPVEVHKGKGFCCAYCRNLARCFEQYSKKIYSDYCKHLMHYLEETDALNRLIFLGYKVDVLTPAEELQRRKEKPDEALIKPEKSNPKNDSF